MIIGDNNMGKKENKTSNRNPIVYWFCVTIFFILILLVSYLCHSTKTLTESQERIITEHVRHIAKVDSLFFDLKEVVLSSDSDKIINAPVLLSQLQKDSAVFKREILLSQEEMSNLVEMHIDKIENDYAQIGIWGGVLSVIFIIFGFFAIFKIEESKSEAKDVLNEVKELGRNASKEVEKLQNQATNLDSSLTKIRQDSNTFLETKTKELQSLVETETKAREELGEITKLLEEVKAKNAQYVWSIEAMHDQMKQLEALSNSLKDIIERNGKGGSNE